MINKKEILKIAKGILRKQKGIRDHQIIHPAREWWIGVLLSLVVFSGIATWSIATYSEYSNTSVVASTQATETGVVYRESLIEAALEQFSERQDNYEQLLLNRVRNIPVVVEEVIEFEIESATTTDDVVIEGDTELPVEEEVPDADVRPDLQ